MGEAWLFWWHLIGAQQCIYWHDSVPDFPKWRADTGSLRWVVVYHLNRFKPVLMTTCSQDNRRFGIFHKFVGTVLFPASPFDFHLAKAVEEIIKFTHHCRWFSLKRGFIGGDTIFSLCIYHNFFLFLSLSHLLGQRLFRSILRFWTTFKLWDKQV